jgi:hypothetical protein
MIVFNHNLNLKEDAKENGRKTVPLIIKGTVK